MSQFIRMMRCERGAVTIDWVVLTAAVVLLGVVAADPIGGTLVVLMESTSTLIESAGEGFSSE
ncbi:MAG TPA: hypothetical protein VJ994_00150 [Paracoccaceae bacterium]|nr:hypothetical protein [Paracoccaceae bacterium]